MKAVPVVIVVAEFEFDFGAQFQFEELDPEGVVHRELGRDFARGVPLAGARHAIIDL